MVKVLESEKDVALEANPFSSVKVTLIVHPYCWSVRHYSVIHYWIEDYYITVIKSAALL